MGIFDNSFTHWLGDRTGIHSLKPVAQIAAPVVGGFLGGPMGAALGSGLFSAGDDLAHGRGIMDAAKHGLVSGGLAYGGAKALGALQNAFSPGSAPSAGFGATAGQGGSEAGSALGSGLGDAAKEAAVGGSAGGGSGFMNALGSAGSWAAKNPNAIGMGLQGAGSIASAGSENTLRNAQAAQLMAQTQAQEDENAAKKQRAAALEPLLRALMGGGGGGIKVAPNPYTTG